MPNNIRPDSKPTTMGPLSQAARKKQSSTAIPHFASQQRLQMSTAKGDHVRFSGNDKAGWKPLPQPTDAARILAALKEAGAQVSDDQAAIGQLKTGGNLPCSKDFYFGMVYLNKKGKPVVTGMAKELQPVADLLFSQPLSPELQGKLEGEGLPLVLAVSPPDDTVKEKVLAQLSEADREELEREEAQKKLEKSKDKSKKGADDEDDNPYQLFMDNVFNKTFSLTKKNGEALPTLAWPILQRIIGSKDPLSDGSGSPIGEFAKKIQALGLYDLHIPSDELSELPGGTLQGLQDKFKPLQTRLAAYKLMEKHYLESIDIKEVALPMMTGVMVGGGGETALEMAHLEGNPYTGLIRTGLLVGVDVIDNMFAQIPNIYQNASKNGWKKDAKGITGCDSWGEYFSKALKGDFKLKGNLGPTIQDAISSAVLGAASGSLFALPAGNVLSNEKESVMARAITGGLGAWGTSLSLPLKLQKDHKKMVESLNQMIQKGWIKAPKDPKAREAFIQDMILQEAMAGTGNSASLKAFGLVPLLSGGILALEQLGLPRKWAQRLYMSISPGAENLLSLGLMMDRNYRTADRSMKAAEARILTSGNQGFSKQDETFYADQFSDKTSKFISNLATNPWTFYGILGTTLAGLYAYMIKQKLSGKKEDPSSKPSHNSGIKLGQTSAPFGRFPAQPVGSTGRVPGSYPNYPYSAPIMNTTTYNPYPSAPMNVGMPATPYTRPPYQQMNPQLGNYQGFSVSYPDAQNRTYYGMNPAFQYPQPANPHLPANRYS